MMASDITAPHRIPPLAIAAAAGVALWVMASAIGQRREAWDAPIYWQVFYPLALVVAGALGFRHPAQAGRLALMLFAAQCLSLAVLSGEIGNLFPLGIVVFGILALPAVLAAKIAARLARRRSPQNGEDDGEKA